MKILDNLERSLKSLSNIYEAQGSTGNDLARISLLTEVIVGLSQICIIFVHPGLHSV